MSKKSTVSKKTNIIGNLWRILKGITSAALRYWKEESFKGAVILDRVNSRQNEYQIRYGSTNRWMR